MILLHFEGKKEKKKKTIIYFEQGEKIQLKAKNQDASGQWPNGNQYKHVLEICLETSERGTGPLDNPLGPQTNRVKESQNSQVNFLAQSLSRDNNYVIYV